MNELTKDSVIEDILNNFQNELIDLAENYAFTLYECGAGDNTMELLTEATVQLGKQMVVSTNFVNTCDGMSDIEFATCLEKFTALPNDQKIHVGSLLEAGDKSIKEILETVTTETS